MATIQLTLVARTQPGIEPGTTTVSALGQAAYPLSYVALSRNKRLIYAYIVNLLLIKDKEKKVQYLVSNPDLPLTSQAPYPLD